MKLYLKISAEDDLFCTMTNPFANPSYSIKQLNRLHIDLPVIK